MGLADVHLQLRPGSDGALALGFINILIRDNLVDKQFVASGRTATKGSPTWPPSTRPRRSRR